MSRAYERLLVETNSMSKRQTTAIWDYVDELRAALRAADTLFDEALPKFDWGRSALDANAIALLNQVPDKVKRALKTI